MKKDNMIIRDLIQETYSAVTANKARSSLTILGIVIGISSVISMISIGQGAQASIESNIQSIGSNLIMVMPGFQRGVSQVSSGRGSAATLTLEDSKAIEERITSVSNVAPEVSRRYQITSKNSNTNTLVSGTVPAFTAARNVEVESGSFVTGEHLKSLAKVAVIGPTTATDLFGENSDPVGASIRINKIDFKVIGVTKSKGGSGFSNQDDIIYVPISTAQRYLSGDTSVSLISIQAEDAGLMTDVQEQVTSLLLERHKIKDATQADFSVMNQSDIVATASSVTSTFTLLLGAIAGISLIVGGIGIMNMMLTTVTERTREIGLRKAIGAKEADISNQFLAEATTLTLVGGVMGVILGWVVSKAITSLAQINTSISLKSVLIAFGVSAAIGIVFGYYPARRAARLNPIESLRYE